MSWSLHIKNGDLSFAGPKGYSKVSGYQKLMQDLRHWLLEPQGTDPMHPDYGSTLDGAPQRSMIGRAVDGETEIAVYNEVMRVLQAYQRQQINRLRRDTQVLSGGHTLDESEILYAIRGVDTFPADDTIVVRVSIKTAVGQTIDLSVPVRT